MTGRLLAVTLAFAITGAPVAMAMCEGACAARSVDAMHGGHGEHHSCHEGVPSNQLEIAAVPHGCGHSDGNDQLGTDNATKVFTPPVVLASCVTFVAPTLDATTANHARAVTHSPPGPLALPTQLRI